VPFALHLDLIEDRGTKPSFQPDCILGSQLLHMNDEVVLEYLESSQLNPIADIEPCSICGATPADQNR
jgi:hypothetical protein